jgi:protein gp37
VADKSGISWTDATWAVIAGCQPVSKGCENCYSARLCATRFAHLPWAKGLAEAITRTRTDVSQTRNSARIRKVTETLGYRWTGKVVCRDDQLAVPFKWHQPKRIFVGDRGDLFHEQVPAEFVAAVFGVMAATNRHTFLVLTKRPERMRPWFELVDKSAVNPGPHSRVGWCVSRAFVNEGVPTDILAGATELSRRDAPWPLVNVWLGTSVCTAAEKVKIDQLRATPAAHRFLSLEPLLEDLGELDLTGIDQVIVGGESGTRARPCDFWHLLRVIRQCKAAGVPVFMKQWGSFPVLQRLPEWHEIAGKWSCEIKGTGDGRWRAMLQDRTGKEPDEWPMPLRVRELAWEVAR